MLKCSESNDVILENDSQSLIFILQGYDIIPWKDMNIILYIKAQVHLFGKVEFSFTLREAYCCADALGHHTLSELKVGCSLSLSILSSHFQNDIFLALNGIKSLWFLCGTLQKGIFCSSGSSLDQCKNTSTGYTPLAMFIFGDSLADVGNNNHLNTIAKAVSYPSGIDFPGGKPTGRYTNGRTVIDIVGQELGLKKFIPPSNDPATVGEVVFHGVNYASGGAGILNKTGYLFGARINLYAQIDNFAKTRQYIIRCLGSTAATELFKNAIFNFAVGCNDYLDNYFTPIFSIPDQIFVSVDVFTDLLISEFRIQLTSLYNLDARKIVVENIPVIGCIPTVREFSELWAPDTCSKQINNAAMLFNRKLKALIRELNSKLVGAKFVYADIYRIFSNLLHNYKAYGFEDNSSACCAKFGRFGGLSFCVPDARLCPDRSKYIFWDNAHPTDAANAVVAKRMVNGNINDMYPINIRKLVGQKKL